MMNAQEIINHPDKYGANEKQMMLLRELYHLLQEYDKKMPRVVLSNDYKKLLKDPEWKPIVKTAKKTLQPSQKFRIEQHCQRH